MFALVLQGSAFGLIVYIVVYAFPKHAKEMRDEREIREKERAEREREGRDEREKRDQRFDKVVNLLQEKFEERNEKLIRTVTEQTKEIVESHEKTEHMLAEEVSRTLAAVNLETHRKLDEMRVATEETNAILRDKLDGNSNDGAD